MSNTVWTKFYWADWSNDPALRVSSLAAQGMWMRLLCIAAEHDPIGYVAINRRPLGVTDIARLCGVTETEAGELLEDLERNGVFARDRKGTIYSRRMVRDAKKAQIARKNGQSGGNPSLSKDKGIWPSDKPPDKGEDNTHKPYANSHERKDGASGTVVPVAAAPPDAFDGLEKRFADAMGELAPCDPVFGPMFAACSKHDPNAILAKALDIQRSDRPCRKWSLLATRCVEELNRGSNARSNRDDDRNPAIIAKRLAERLRQDAGGQDYGTSGPAVVAFARIAG